MPRYVRELLESVGGEVVLVLLDRLQAGSVEVVDGSAEADRLGHRCRAGLELVGQVAPGRPVGLHLADHVTPDEERLHSLQELRPSPDGSDPAGAAHLVPRDGEEVAADRLHIDRTVRRRLGGVADDDRATAVCPLRNPLRRC